MLSEVALSGRLGDLCPFPGCRYVEIDRVVCTESGGKYEVDKVPVKSYGGLQSHFLTAPKGAFIVLKGRLETREGLGVIFLSVMQEIFSSLSR